MCTRVMISPGFLHSRLKSGGGPTTKDLRVRQLRGQLQQTSLLLIDALRGRVRRGLAEGVVLGLPSPRSRI